MIFILIYINIYKKIIIMYISFNNFSTNYNKYIKSNNTNYQSNPNFSK